MASINKLSIRGVRAFSPEDEEQVVEFYFPLTIITGANGCGKTTIIESLKFALSGSMPPGGATRSAGQSFVHDPRSIGQSNVKANVKLRFTNKAGSSMVVIRSMEVTQKKTTMQFKQLDGVIRTIDAETGQRVTLSHKCTELDKQIPSLLGVSKAILDYVLFVHQEDSSWPLQEASVLKKRFDDIFDSTRYTKALESFRKTKKELAAKVKDIKADVAEYGSHKHAAKQFRQEHAQQQQSLDKLEAEMAECDRLAAEAEEDLEKYCAIMEKIDGLQKKIAQKDNERRNLESVMKAQREMLDKDLTEEHTKEQLQEKLNDFDKEMKEEKDRQVELQRELRRLRGEIQELRRKQDKLNSSKGKVAAEKKAQDERLKEQHTMMTKLAQTYSLDLRQSMTQLTMDDSFVENPQEEPQPLSKEDLQGFLRDLQKKEDELRETLTNHKRNTRTQEEEINSALQELVGNKKAFDNERKKLADESKSIENEVRQLTGQLATKRTKKSTVEEARDQLKQAQRNLENQKDKDEREKLSAEIRSATDKIGEIKNDMELKQSAKVRLKSSAGLVAELELLKNNAQKDAQSLYESIESKKNQLRDYAIDLPDNLPDDPTIVNAVPEIVDSIESEYQKAKRKSEKANQEWEKAKTKLAEVQVHYQNVRSSLSSLEKRRDALKKSGGSVSKVKRVVADMADMNFELSWKVESDDPQELLETLNNSLKEIEDSSPEDIPPDVLAKVMKRIKKKGKADGSCPCCRRDFSGNEQKAFSEAIKGLGDKTSSPLLRGDDEELEQWRKTKAKLEGFRSTIYSSTNDLHDYRRVLGEIAEKRPKVDHGESVFRDNQKEVDCSKKAAADSKKHTDALRDLHETSKRWSQDAGRIEEQSSNIVDKEESVKCETAGSIGDGTLDEVEEKLLSLQEDQAALYDKISKKNKKIASINQEVTEAQRVATSRAERLRQLEGKYAEEQKSAERKQVLDERKTAVSKEISKLGEQIHSLQQKIRAKESEKARLSSHAQDEETKHSETLNQFVADMKRLNDLSTRIDQFENDEEEGRLERIESEVAKVKAKIDEKDQQCAKLQPELESASKIVDDQERQKKALRDNIELHDSTTQLSKVEEEKNELKKAMSAVEGGDTANDLMHEADKKKSKYVSRKQNLVGRHAEIREQLRSLKRKLSSPEYRNVDAQHQEAVIKKQTTEMAAADLDKYASALDKALLRFHSIKIAEINKLIKELWLKCYQGNDITNIELESGQESRAAKSYNYRVVMSKGNTKMDMRGRCSAGQRVLASIVIRLALAETFGVHCGCLVLDEPTVNLDEANRHALAQAMAQIIASRSTQSNFQLVLITHDEDFISLMKSELGTQTGFSVPEKYFLVRREEGSPGKWYSKIDAMDWDELL